MKIKTGGGGIDANGNAYTLPEIEREVPHDYFKQFAKAIASSRAKQRPLVMFCSPQQLKDLKANARADQS